MITHIDSSSPAVRGRTTLQLAVDLKTRKRPTWHSAFLRMLPSIRRHAEVRFRHVNATDREDAVQEVIARALLDYLRLIERGKEAVAFAGPLARYAVAQVRRGRRVGGRLNIRDVSSEYCRVRKGVLLESLDRDENSSDWREVLVEDRHSTPAEIAATRIDVGEWLKTLPGRSRRLAERLATGETTSDAAQLFGISPARVSQLRRELHHAWNSFQAETDSTL
jgi:DNA-directed RNA polymerase specialized sigma24 family protein